ncbi:MAG: FGGY family carbohydrate kinase [Planctomycetota bacterium]|nr:FGGY family carbohydrate kinase [Planctomycetota bacterium]
MSVIGLDIGTTGVKACAFDADGKLLARSYREYPLSFPQSGWIEIDPKQVLEATHEVLAEAAAKAKAAGDPVQAVATSAQGEAVTPTDERGAPLGMSIVTFDKRTEKYVKFWDEKLGRQKFFEITGMPLHGMYTLPKVQWWKDERPEVYAKARYFLCYEDLAALAVFGLPPVIGTSLAGRAGAYDLKARAWSKELFEKAGLDASRWATPKPAGTVVGEIPAARAAELGFAKGALLVAGGHDQALCALGCGIDRPGRASYVTGTVECMAPVFDAPVLAPAMQAHNFCCYESALPRKYLSITFNFTGGSLLKWCRDTLFPEVKAAAEAEQQEPYERLLAGLPDGPTGILILPHFTTTGTPHLDTRSRGAIVGLQLETKREELLKAVLEGVTYEMALNARLQRENGIAMQEYRAIGGGAQSAAWMRIKADILGVPVARMENGEAGCLGAAMLGLTALGTFKNLGEACALAKVATRFEPDAKRHAAYAERLDLYAKLYPALKETAHGLAGL